MLQTPVEIIVYMRPVFVLFFFVFHLFKVCATTWSAALPYVQRTESQQVVIMAKAYEPYMPNPYGETKVYFKNKLLYSIDRYFRSPIHASDNGEYLVNVVTTNSYGVSSAVYFGQNWIDFNAPAITIYKKGKLYKIYTIRDIVDTARLLNDGVFYSWGYTLNWNEERVREMKFGCESCLKVYGREVLNNCDTNEIDLYECEACNNDCDSFMLFNKELAFLEKTVFVKNNVLNIMTNQGKVIQLDFRDLTIKSVSIDAIVVNKETFDPPQTVIDYDTAIVLPEKFDEPSTVDGENINVALAKYLNVQPHSKGKKSWGIRLYKMVIGRSGFCEELDFNIARQPEKNRNGVLSNLSNKKLKEKIEEWLMRQQYDISILPTGFEKYSFYTFLDFSEPE